MLTDDLRIEWYKLIDTQLFIHILNILPPLIISKSTKQRKFEEIDTPKNDIVGS